MLHSKITSFRMLKFVTLTKVFLNILGTGEHFYGFQTSLNNIYQSMILQTVVNLLELQIQQHFECCSFYKIFTEHQKQASRYKAVKHCTIYTE